MGIGNTHSPTPISEDIFHLKTIKGAALACLEPQMNTVNELPKRSGQNTVRIAVWHQEDGVKDYEGEETYANMSLALRSVADRFANGRDYRALPLLWREGQHLDATQAQSVKDFFSARCNL